jgi:type III secretion protein J
MMATGRSPSWTGRLHCLLALLLGLLGGCSGQITLQTGLSDRDANEIVTLLRRNGIHATKTQVKTGVTLAVAETELARATELMQAAGLPRRAHDQLGQIFKKDGMISTPMEERARYLHALSQELEFTLSQIDRVVVARVHVVLPERVAPGEPVQPSSASVFVKFRAPFDEDLLVPRIKRLVASSIPGLSSEDEQHKLSVVLVPAEAIASTVEWQTVGPLMLEAGSARLLRLWGWLALGALVLGAGASAGFVVWRRRSRQRRQDREAAHAQDSTAGPEPDADKAPA